MCVPFASPPMLQFAPTPQVRQINGWVDVGDFWNDPRRWDGISDPHRDLFWMPRTSAIQAHVSGD